MRALSRRPLRRSLHCVANGQDPCHRREAVRRAGPRARSAGPVPEAHGRRRAHHALARRPGAPRHVGRRSPRPARRAGRVRRQVQEVADGRSADRAAPLQARRARRALAEADGGRPRPPAPRRRRPHPQRLRRGPRGRAHLQVGPREGERRQRRRRQADRAPVAVVDDEAGDARRARAPAPRRGDEAARGGGEVALRGRLDRRHERDARRDDPPALVVRRRGVARPRADADARDPHPARGGDPRLQAREVLARRRALRHRRRPPLRRPLPRRARSRA